MKSPFSCYPLFLSNSFFEKSFELVWFPPVVSALTATIWLFYACVDTIL
jgi:hypothetical protein